MEVTCENDTDTDRRETLQMTFGLGGVGTCPGQNSSVGSKCPPTTASNKNQSSTRKQIRSKSDMSRVRRVAKTVTARFLPLIALGCFRTRLLRMSTDAVVNSAREAVGSALSKTIAEKCFSCIMYIERSLRPVEWSDRTIFQVTSTLYIAHLSIDGAWSPAVNLKVMSGEGRHGRLLISPSTRSVSAQKRLLSRREARSPGNKTLVAGVEELIHTDSKRSIRFSSLFPASLLLLQEHCSHSKAPGEKCQKQMINGITAPTYSPWPKFAKLCTQPAANLRPQSQQCEQQT